MLVAILAAATAVTVHVEWTKAFHGAEHVATITSAFLSTGIGSSVIAWYRLRSQIRKVNAEAEAVSIRHTVPVHDNTRLDRIEADLAAVTTALKCVVSKLGRLQTTSDDREAAYVKP